jgi:hypothetical protein
MCNHYYYCGCVLAKFGVSSRAVVSESEGILGGVGVRVGRNFRWSRSQSRNF